MNRELFFATPVYVKDVGSQEFNNKLEQNIISNYTSFNYTDIFEITPPICNADPIEVQLYAVSAYNNCNYYYKNVNCCVVTEPVV